MKKIALSLASVLVATAFAPEAAAVPAFARQTGMACSQCHFQKFPVLNSTGQDFKAGGYTQLSAKGKFKGEDLSIPDTLNMGMLFNGTYTKNTTVAAPASGKGHNAGNGVFTVPAELAIFIAGRVGDHMGVFTESNMAFGNNNGGVAVTMKFPFSYEVNGTRLLAVPFTNDGGSGGPSYGFELAATGVQDNIMSTYQFRDTASARVYTIAHSPGATGVALVAKTDYGYINITPYTTSFLMDGGLGGNVLGDNRYVRIVATPTIGDWNLHAGVALYSGSSEVLKGGGQGGPVAATAVKTDTKATVLDLEAQGQVAGKDLLFQVSYAKADANGTNPNHINGGGFNVAGSKNQRDALTVFANYSVIPRLVTVGGSIRRGHTGDDTVNAVGAKESDNAIMLVVGYEFYQNVNFEFNYATFSGAAYNAGGSKAVGGVGQGTGKSAFGMTMSAAF